MTIDIHELRRRQEMRSRIHAAQTVARAAGKRTAKEAARAAEQERYKQAMAEKSTPKETA